MLLPMFRATRSFILERVDFVRDPKFVARQECGGLDEMSDVVRPAGQNQFVLGKLAEINLAPRLFIFGGKDENQLVLNKRFPYERDAVLRIKGKRQMAIEPSADTCCRNPSTIRSLTSGSVVW
jgi:hypothetical protein